MAKKKALRGRKVRKRRPNAPLHSSLTREELATTADVLSRTSRNVHRFVRATFGKEVGDEILRDLFIIHGLFQCANCERFLEVNAWMDDTSKSLDDVLICRGCIDEVDQFNGA